MCLILFEGVGLFGYLNFYDATKGNIIDSFDMWWVNAVFRIIEAFSIFVTFPTAIFPARLSLDNVFKDIYYIFSKKSEEKTPLVEKQAEEEDPKTLKEKIAVWFKTTFTLDYLRLIIETALFGFVCFLLAVFYPKVEDYFSLTGSTASTMAAFVFPPLIYIKLTTNKWMSWQVIGSIIVLIFGSIMGTFVTGVTLYNIISPMDN